MVRVSLVVLATALACSSAVAQPRHVAYLAIPDVGGYLTLKCDFHVHTVFSDGEVWPTFRVQEAVAEGLDAIALTDHVEYQPKGDYVSRDRNAPYRIARQAASEAGLILIPGAEITRPMPPGHLNALFLQDANALAKDTWEDAVAEAARQGAVIFWNHPGWEGQQPDGVARWYDEHTSLYEQGVLAGIEVVNAIDYYPDVLAWCLEKKIAILGNSDTHAPIEFEYRNTPWRPRPMTLVFAKERSAPSIKEAILARRTAVKRGDELIGEDTWLRQVFEQSVRFDTLTVSMTGRERITLRATNVSDIPYTLALMTPDSIAQFPREFTLLPRQTTLISLRPRRDAMTFTGTVTATYEVTNLHIGASRVLSYPFSVRVRIAPKR